MDSRDGDERLGLDLLETTEEVLLADAGVDQDGDGTHLEEGEDEGEELARGRDEEGRPGAAMDPRALEAVCEPARLGLQVGEGPGGVLEAAAPPRREDDRVLPGLAAGHLLEVPGDVDALGELHGGAIVSGAANGVEWAPEDSRQQAARFRVLAVLADFGLATFGFAEFLLVGFLSRGPL